MWVVMSLAHRLVKASGSIKSMQRTSPICMQVAVKHWYHMATVPLNPDITEYVLARLSGSCNIYVYVRTAYISWWYGINWYIYIYMYNLWLLLCINYICNKDIKPYYFQSFQNIFIATDLQRSTLIHPQKVVQSVVVHDLSCYQLFMEIFH